MWLADTVLCSLQWAGGPKIDMLYGRKDVSLEDECAIDGVLPGTRPTACRDHQPPQSVGTALRSKGALRPATAPGLVERPDTAEQADFT